jgi:hypothetical protein
MGQDGLARVDRGSRVVEASPPPPEAASTSEIQRAFHVVGGRLRLGCGQRLPLVELGGPRDREPFLVALGRVRR